MSNRTAEFLAEQKRLAEAATEGPWERDWYDGVKDPKSRLMTAYEGRNHCLGEYLTEEDATFIAAARTTVPKLIVAIEAVVQICNRLGVVNGDVSQPAPSYYVGVGRQVVADEIRRAIEAALGGEGDGE